MRRSVPGFAMVDVLVASLVLAVVGGAVSVLALGLARLGDASVVRAAAAHDTLLLYRYLEDDGLRAQTVDVNYLGDPTVDNVRFTWAGPAGTRYQADYRPDVLTGQVIRVLRAWPAGGGTETETQRPVVEGLAPGGFVLSVPRHSELTVEVRLASGVASLDVGLAAPADAPAVMQLMQAETMKVGLVCRIPPCAASRAVSSQWQTATFPPQHHHKKHHHKRRHHRKYGDGDQDGNGSSRRPTAEAGGLREKS